MVKVSGIKVLESKGIYRDSVGLKIKNSNYKGVRVYRVGRVIKDGDSVISYCIMLGDDRHLNTVCLDMKQESSFKTDVLVTFNTIDGFPFYCVEKSSWRGTTLTRDRDRGGPRVSFLDDSELLDRKNCTLWYVCVPLLGGKPYFVERRDVIKSCLGDQNENPLGGGGVK